MFLYREVVHGPTVHLDYLAGRQGLIQYIWCWPWGVRAYSLGVWIVQVCMYVYACVYGWLDRHMCIVRAWSDFPVSSLTARRLDEGKAGILSAAACSSPMWLWVQV